MSAEGDHPEGPSVELINHQDEYFIRRAEIAAFAQELKRKLRLGSRGFNVCFVDDREIQRLNWAFRGKNQATDVLSFPWNEPQGHGGLDSVARRSDDPGIENFLGEVVISVPAAQRNAREEKHSTLNEFRWLILHGVLHLLGYDHETDHGEMIALELELRRELGITGFGPKRKLKKSSAKGVTSRVRA